MELTAKDLELIANEKNKELFNTLYDLTISQFEDALRFTDLSDMSQLKMDTMGTCGIYLSSMVELLHTLKDALDKGFIESGGTLATACWERALTLRMIMIDPVANAQKHTDHEGAKTTPWKVFAMVKEVIRHERTLTGRPEREFEDKNFYLQYTFLSSIKHGNPHTISYLNRPDRSSETRLFRLKANDSFEDKDLKLYIKMLAADIALEALLDYSRAFRTEYKALQSLRDNIDGLLPRVQFYVPPVMKATREEMGEAYWKHLEERSEQLRRQWST